VNRRKAFKRHWQPYLLAIPPIIYFLNFKYFPMLNAVLAFKDYNVIKGIWGSPWVGMKYFDLFFNNPAFITLLKNTMFVSLYQLAISFPIPIILAIGLNEVSSGRFRKLQL
jgi:putative aldouronate transport system permease protein